MIKLKITTHDHESFEVEVESYDPVELNQQINNHDLNTLQIGDLIISRVNIKTIIPVREDDQA